MIARNYVEDILRICVRQYSQTLCSDFTLMHMRICPQFRRLESIWQWKIFGCCLRPSQLIDLNPIKHALLQRRVLEVLNGVSHPLLLLFIHY